MLGGVLNGTEGEQWKEEPRQMPEEFEEWIDAQIASKQASGAWSTYVDIIRPLDQKKSKATLDRMWAQIRSVRQCVRSYPLDR